MVHDPIQPTWGDDPSVDYTNGVRQELGSPDMPFVVARISSEYIGWGSGFTTPNWEPGRQVTRADLVNGTRELTPAAFIDVDDRPGNDGWHYLNTEYPIIGQRFADTLVQLANSPIIRPERTVFTGTSQQITITAPAGSATVYYTLNGSTPTSASTAYSAPFALDHSATIKAVAYRSGAPAGPVVEKRFTKLVALPAQTPATTAAGVRVRPYPTESAAIFPGFETAGAPFTVTASTQTRLSRSFFSSWGWNIVHCTAYINIPQDDVYEFQVTTRDWRQPDPDYRLVINDTPVDRQVALKAGLHRFRFDHVNRGLALLTVAIKGGTYTDFTLLLPEIYSHETSGGNPVSFEVSRLAVDLPSAASSVESVFVSSDVASWTASSNQTWLNVAPGSGAYHEAVALTAQANSTGSPRTATVTLAGSGAATRTFSVTQAANDAASPEAVVASPAEGATTTLAITTAGAWSLSHESNPWFDCEPASGTGNATVTIRARKNYLTTERACWVQLNTGGATSQRVKVRQSGEPAYLSPSVTQLALVSDANANPVEFDSVVVRSNVNWTATSSASWLNVNAAAQQTLNGSGNGRIWLLANAANTSPQAREGFVTITATGLPSQTITVIQPGTGPFLAASPGTVVINRGDAATFYVSSNQGSWNGISDQSWLTVTKTSMPNRFALRATANTTGAKRTANITVSSGTATPVVVPVTQNASGKFLAFEPAPSTIGSGANQSTTVLVDADEDWSVTSVSAPWLTATASLPVTNGLTEPLLREHTPALIPATEKKLRRLFLNAESTNTTGASRQANVVLTSSSGETLSATVTQASDVLAVDTSSLPNGTVNAPYSQTVLKSGGVGPFTWAVTSGSLPAGLALSAVGVFSGTPSAQGTSNFTVTVTDSNSATALRELTIIVDPAPAIPPTITTASLPGGVTGSSYSQTLASTGGTGALTWTISSGSLPAGLTLSSAGVISGAPSAVGTSNFTVLVTDSLSATDTQALGITINAPVVTDAIYYNGSGGHGNLNATLTATGTTGQVAIDAAHKYYPTVTTARYYGGTVTFDRSGGVWSGNHFQFLIGNAADPWTRQPGGHAADTAILTTQDGSPDWNFSGSNGSIYAGGGSTGISANTPGTFDFVIKLEKYSPWEEVTMKIFLGAKATAVTEGTPDFFYNYNGFASTIDYMSWTLFRDYNQGTPSLTTSNMFSASTWTPVGGSAPLTGMAAWFDSYGLPTDGTGNGSLTAILAGDGLTNLMKYALGIDPDIPGYQGKLTTAMVNVSSSDYLSLNYTRPEPAPAGVTYTPETSADLSTWSGSGMVEVSSTVVGGLRTITVRDGTAMSAASRRFLRLKVTAP